jgi:hypothetical protein
MAFTGRLLLWEFWLLDSWWDTADEAGNELESKLSELESESLCIGEFREW